MGKASRVRAARGEPFYKAPKTGTRKYVSKKAAAEMAYQFKAYQDEMRQQLIDAGRLPGERTAQLLEW